jgi:hypothetical protein
MQVRHAHCLPKCRTLNGFPLTSIATESYFSNLTRAAPANAAAQCHWPGEQSG